LLVSPAKFSLALPKAVLIDFPNPSLKEIRPGSIQLVLENRAPKSLI